MQMHGKDLDTRLMELQAELDEHMEKYDEKEAERIAHRVDELSRWMSWELEPHQVALLFRETGIDEPTLEETLGRLPAPNQHT